MTETVKANGWAGWLLSMLQRGRSGIAARRTARTLQTLETLSLGGRRQIALVRCGDEQFLVGMSGDGVSTIVPVQGEAK
jgi:flagellar biogenesis protein FliO